MAALVGFVMFAQAVCMSSDVCADMGRGADLTGVNDAATETDSNAAPDLTVESVPVQQCDMPICGALGNRLWCIEGLESRHFGGAVNPTSGARGFLQWLSSTARAWGVTPGNRQSEWLAAATMYARGEAFFRSQWPVTARLCP